MFCLCSSLIELNLRNFNLSSIINMSYMFSYCKSLKKLNFPNFEKPHWGNTYGIFLDCPIKIVT